MPYYRWRGVDLGGRTKKGCLFARSNDHLDQLLLKKNVALLSCKQQRQWAKRPIRLSHQLQLFQHLTTLIDAGILIPDALTIVANQVEHPQLQEKMHEVAQRVISGIALSDALTESNVTTNPIIVQLIKAGEESGKVPFALNAICAHMQATQDFYQRLRSALLLPAVTLLFFFVIIMIIFTVIMPRFIDIFSSMNAQIPPLTQTLLSVSDFIRSPAMGLLLSISALIVLIVWRMSYRPRVRRIRDTFVLSLPFIGPILQQRFLSYALRAIAVLLEGGVPLARALSIVSMSVRNHIFQSYLAQMEQAVISGNALSDAMAQLPADVFSPDTIAMIEVGQESGRLTMLLQRAAQLYHRRVMQKLSWLTLLVQPTVMIFLGLLVALLIFAVYGPIFTMSRIF